ncbi:uncharacterized protein LOC110019017 [Phalaenopsis equestris]|uniref:uncharacterized protein LOC110019017 n=1 Tax=Phalaenopsis equestris TaxID=78828 RepID=UPI0009E32533|nr:uncharacterized protein LOC110019017 [Phalaenopsis equestris]
MLLQAVPAATILLAMLLSAQLAANAAAVLPQGSTSQVEDAELFRLYYGQRFKVIKNSVDGQSYLLMQNNSTMALRTKYCTGRIKSFVVPLFNYSVDTISFPVSFFELLGLLDGLKGITTESVASQCVLKSYSNENIQLINRTDIKQIAQFTAYFTSNIGQQQPCNFAAFLPMEERTPLQKAEWIKYLAAFTNSEARANLVYDAIKGNYNCLSKAAANLTTRFKPVVAWMDYNEGIWTFSREDYKLKYVTDAGGENVDATISNHNYNVSNPDDMDDFYALLCTVDVLIDQTYAPEPAEYSLSTFLDNCNMGDDANFDFLTNQRVWRFDKRVHSCALDWYDGAISQPQLVLADLIAIFFPTGNYTLTYFRNIAKNEGVISVAPESCNRSTSTPLDPIIVQC